MLNIDIGLSAIRASQQAMSAISNNIANASTEGYHRQRVELIDRPPVTSGPLQIGTGVDVSSLTRLRDTATEAALVTTNSLHAESETYLRILDRVETMLIPSEGSLFASVSNFFNQIEQLAAEPSTVTIRDSVLAAADQVATQMEELNSRFNQLRTDNALAISEEVDAINQLTVQMAELNTKIRIQTHSGSQPNTLLDQRDRLISQLAERVDVSIQSFLVPGSPLVAAGGAIIVAEQSTQLVALTDETGSAVVQTPESGLPVIPSSGSLLGLISGQETLDTVQAALQDWANRFIGAIDQLQATGLGQGGSFQHIAGVRSVDDATITLADSDSPFPIQAGRLAVTVTDESTGIRTSQYLSFDPDSDSLNDLLADLNSIAHVSASYHPDSGHVTIRTEPGFQIDFAGGVDPLPSTSALTGTASVRLIGRPGDTENQRWEATVVGTGDVGISSGLSLVVTDADSGELINTLDIGAGYIPGGRLLIANEVSVSLTAGTVNTGEQITFDIINDPDETGILTALGLNTFFAGDASTGIQLNKSIQQSPLAIAASRTGEAGDATNLRRMIQLREAKTFAERGETVEERLASLTTALAFRIEAENAGLEQLQQQQLHLENTRDAVSGVDPNEELVTMLEFQRMFQAASRFVTVIDEALDELMRLIG